MRVWLVLLLAGCPASADSSEGDAAVPPSCAVPPAAGERCTIDLDAMPRELTAAADGSLYVIDAGGRVERHVPAATGCAFTRDAAFVSPPGGWRSIEATRDGRIYLAKVEDGRAVLSWIGTSTGACSDTRAYRPVIAAGDDGSVVLAPLTGNGLRRITTSPCGATELAFAATDAVRALGRFGDDIVYGTAASRARVSPSGVVQFRESAAYEVGLEHSLEGFGGAIASWSAGALVRVDAASGAALPSIAWDVEDALFDATPDGSAGYLLGRCGSLYRLSP